ncbi:TLC domain-containing protein 5a isoform X2 [Tachysurus fulvidraco]|uniref:TLC domain-containing protein 5a isoform X2 n=1 Tax=Tachysurus fulvidraco TaxID=1234273 RepID=UPI001FEE839B|nr:TLC domain-containing protein 5a isoform X2 [Tachysurus fulvidraco]
METREQKAVTDYDADTGGYGHYWEATELQSHSSKMSPLVLGVGVCLAGWIALYALLCYTNGSCGYEWNCRLVTLFHGILAVCITAYIGYVDGPWPFTYPGTKNTPLQITAMVVSLGYFIFDMAWCVYFQTEGLVMLAHHTMSILGILLTLWLGESGIESCAVIFGSEITNPLLQTRWFLKHSGRYNTFLGDLVDVLFVFLFVIMRVFVGGAMLYCELISPRPKFIIKCGGVAMYILSWVFVADIFRFAYRKSSVKFQHWKSPVQVNTDANSHAIKRD